MNRGTDPEYGNKRIKVIITEVIAAKVPSIQQTKEEFR